MSGSTLVNGIKNIFHKNTMQYFEEGRDYYAINDTYYSLIVVTQFPDESYFGMFNDWGNKQHIKCFIKTKPSELDLRTHLTREVKAIEQKHRNANFAREKALEEEYRKQLESINEFIASLSHSRDKTLDVSVAFVVSHTEKKEMEIMRKELSSSLLNDGCRTYVPKYTQVSFLKYFVPFFSSRKALTTMQEFNIGNPIGSSAFAIGYPFVFVEKKDINGFLYAHEINTKGSILWNPSLYFEDEDIAVEQNILDGNIVLIGSRGSGKTTDMFLITRKAIRSKHFVMWIDPENTNKKYTLSNGGSYFEFGSDTFMFNPFHLIRVSNDNEDEEVKYEAMWNTEMAINQAIDHLKSILRLYQKEITDNALSKVGEIARLTYESKGITDSELFDKFEATDFPTLSDFANILDNAINEISNERESLNYTALEELRLKITPMMEEHKHYFDGHTTVDIELRPGNMIGIGTKNLYMKEQLQDALYFIIYNHAFNYCLDKDVPSTFIYDEAHTNLDRPMTRDLLDTFTRRSRKYLNHCVVGSQEVLDFEDKNGNAGIINNSSYIIIKHLQNENSFTALKRIVGASDDEIAIMRSFTRGDSLFISGNQKYFTHTLLSDREKFEKGNNY